MSPLDFVHAIDHPRPFERMMSYVYYSLVDDESDNILLYVDDCTSKISRCVGDHGASLVHCVQGVSRSVALTTAYIMKTQALDFESAYSVVKTAYPQANIADNFRTQLRDYGEVFGWDMSLHTQAHRLYRSKHRIARICEGEESSGSHFRYLCGKCRESLFLDCHVVLPVTSNYRIECMQWMSPDVDGAVEGLLVCPRCKAKIGHFNWSGLLGDHDIPGFMITKSKVDQMSITSGFKGVEFPKSRF